MRQPSVVIVSTYRYPDGDAGSVRHHALARMAEAVGYQPTVVALGPHTAGQVRLHEGLPYLSLRRRANSLPARIQGRLSFGRRLVAYLDSRASTDAVIVGDLPLDAMNRVRAWSRKRGIVLVHDSVEWYSPGQFRLGRLDPSFIHKEFVNRLVVRPPWRVIAISSGLQQHFARRGAHAVRIPAVLDVAAVKTGGLPGEERLRFVYAGSPGRKDDLVGFCRAVLGAVDGPDRVRVDLVGVTKEMLVQQGLAEEEVAALAAIVTCHGRLPRSDTLRIVQSADFSILFRPARERYAQMGFPTKVAEALSLGVPVFLNATSDLGEYLSDGTDSIICADESVSSIRAGLARILELSVEDLGRLRVAARETAERCFDDAAHLQALASVLGDGSWNG